MKLRYWVLTAAMVSAVFAQTPQPVNAAAAKIAAQIIEAKTDAEARNILDAAPAAQVADVAREVAAQSYQVLQRGDPARGLRLVEMAETAAARTGDIEARALCAYWRSVILVTSGDEEGALHSARGALAWARNTRAASGLLQVCGDAMRLLGDPVGAIAEYHDALEAARKLGSAVREAQVLNSLGLAYVLAGQYRPALEAYEKALQVAEAEKHAELISSVKNNLGGLYAAQGRHELSLRYYEESLAIKRTQGSKPRILSGLINLATVTNSIGRNDLASTYLAEAFPLAEESGNQRMLAYCYRQRAAIEVNDGKLDQAIADFERALERIDSVDVPTILVPMGQALVKKGDLAGALDRALRSRAAADESRFPEAQWRTASLLGSIYRRMNKLPEAESSYRRAISIIEDLRTNIAGVEEDRERYLEDKLEPYRGLFSILAEAGRADEAFAAAEQTKARVLAEVVANGKLRITKGMTREEQEREESLRRHLMAARQSRAPNAREEADRAAGEYASFQTALYASHPELALRRTHFDPVQAKDVTAQLPDSRTAAIEYFFAEDAVFAMVAVGGDPHIHFYKLAAAAKTVEAKAARFRTALAGRELGFQPLARELYQLVLAPIKEIKGKKTLIFVPDGPLWQVPFQALESNAGRYLIEDASVSYAPSLTVLAEMRKRPERVITGVPALLALGNPLLSPRAGLPPLPTAEQEVNEIGKLYGTAHSRVLVGAQAEKSVLFDTSASYSVLHIATHGVLDARNPMYSHLYLAPHGDDPGILEAWEVMSLDLHEDVIVLSSCEMARGAVGEGEGLLGMSWAMFVAGAPTTVASQWKADAASTTALMTDFHRSLRRRLVNKSTSATKAEALQHAMLTCHSRPEFKHPYYWAAFVMLGDGF